MKKTETVNIDGKVWQVTDLPEDIQHQVSLMDEQFENLKRLSDELEVAELILKFRKSKVEILLKEHFSKEPI